MLRLIGFLWSGCFHKWRVTATSTYEGTFTNGPVVYLACTKCGARKTVKNSVGGPARACLLDPRHPTVLCGKRPMTYISDIYMDDSRTMTAMPFGHHARINQHHPKTVLDVLDTCGLEEALLVISNAMRDDTLDRHLTAWALRSVLHVFESDFPTDRRPRMAIDALDNDDADIVDRERMRGLVRMSGGNAARLEPHGPSHLMCYAVLYSTAARSLSIARTIGGPTIEEQEQKLRSMI